MSEATVTRLDPRREVELGRIVQTARAAEELPRTTVMDALRRHRQGRWGLVDDHDARLNARAIEHGGRVMSVWAYTKKDDTDGRFWIISEGGGEGIDGQPVPRVTTVLLPEDY